MSARGRGAYRGGRGNNFSRRTPKGLFKDNIWLCNCEPRLPAEHFKVKKEGKNQGRWFYTCQQSEPKRCDFFLWEEDAKPREEAAVLANSHNEPTATATAVPAVDEGWTAGRSTAPTVQNEVDKLGPPSPRSSPSSSNSNARKRSAQHAQLDQNPTDDDLDWALSRDEEADLLKQAELASPHTPNKSLRTGVYASPSTTAASRRKLPWLEPPLSPLPDQLSPSPSRAPLRNDARDVHLQVNTPAGQTERSTTPLSPANTTRYKDALKNPDDSASSLTVDALSVLASITVPSDIVANLRSILSRHDLKTQGITRGRDISRLALKAKDAKIAELEARIVSLKAEREVDRSVIRSLQTRLPEEPPQ